MRGQCANGRGEPTPIRTITERNPGVPGTYAAILDDPAQLGMRLLTHEPSEDDAGILGQ